MAEGAPGVNASRRRSGTGVPCPSPTLTPGALEEARERTLALVAPLRDADVETAHSALMSPLVWDLGHIAAYEDLWLVHRHGGEPLLHPELAAMYDAFETPRAVRGDLALLDRARGARRTSPRSASARWRCSPAAARPRLHEMVLRHEQQHNETMLQAIELAALGTRARRSTAARPARARRAATPASSRSRCPAARCLLGAPGDRFAYDNERPRHVVDVRPFRIGRTPITNATFLTFVEGGGYERREWWSDEGWSWKEDYDITHPGGWAPGATGGGSGASTAGRRCTPTSPSSTSPGSRPTPSPEPTELASRPRQEWEKAATWDQERGRSLPYPWGERPAVAGDGRANLDQTGLGPRPAGRCPPAPRPAARSGCSATCGSGRRPPSTATPASRRTRTASTPRSSSARDYRVLRGGSWATRARVATPTFRNWDLPQRRQIFSGLRLAWDAS